MDLVGHTSLLFAPIQRILRMWICFILLGSLACFAQGEEAPLASQDPPLRVMTFNIRYGTAADGENAWPKRRAMVMDVIGRHEPHVVGIQEALHFQLEEIRHELPHFGVVGVGRDDGRQAGEYAAILYDKRRLEVLDKGTFWFADTPLVAGSITWDGSLPRTCAWMHCRDRATRRSFYVYNVHWDHASQVSREKSAALLLERIRSRAEPEDPVLVTGDFNAGEKNTAFVRLTSDPQTRLRCTFRAVHPEASDVGTFHGFSGGADGRKIDAVLASSEWQVEAASIDRFHRDGRYPSDHFPVTATVRFGR